MQGSRTALKVISVITIIYAALILILSILLFTGGGLLGMGSTVAQYGEDATILAGIALFTASLLLIMGLLYLIIGILGFRGARNPRKIGPFYVLSIIGVIISVVQIVASIIQGSFNISSLGGLVIVVICALLAGNIRKHARNQSYYLK